VFYLRKWATPRAQVFIHVALVLLVLAFLPLRVHAPFAAPNGNTAIAWLFATLLLSLGLPLLVLSATSPLLQSWFGATSHERAQDPYFLYAASNAGSLLGLLVYPLALEPLLGLHAQGRIWAVGYLALLACIIAAAFIFIRESPRAVADTEAITTPEHIQRRRKLRWLLLAFIPSSLMLSVTTYISTSIAPIPLMWVVPLALYLITLIIAFSAGLEERLAGLRRYAPAVVMPLIVILAVRVELWSPFVNIFIHLVAFFFIALTCHSLLAADRPDKAHLAEYYLWFAAGGAAGGIFTAIIAPVIFRSVLEYPLVLVLAAFYLREPPKDSAPSRVWDFYLPLALGAALAIFVSFAARDMTPDLLLRTTIAFAVAALIALILFRRPIGFAVSVATLLLCGLLYQGMVDDELSSERNFFGIKLAYGFGAFHFMYHGPTMHGIEDERTGNQTIPLAYYTRTGPLGQIFASRRNELRHGSIAVVGLGIGTSLCYRTPGQQWAIYEIDPAVDRMARDPKLFQYVSLCAPDVPTTLGDARLSLEKASDDAYDLMILDAYSADYIPVHLITREALSLYLRKLRQGGILAFHITNTWFDLQWVLEPLARDLGLSCYVEHDRDISSADARAGKKRSDWLVLARTDSDLGAVAHDPRWSRCPPAALRVWTDDYSSLITAIPFDFSIGTR
jgi:hypothetical protein